MTELARPGSQGQEAALRDVLQVLDPSGHIEIVWNPNDPAEVAHARSEVARLREQGYSFFAVVGPAEGAGDEVERGRGRLIVERIEDPTQPAPEPKSEGAEAEAPSPARRGGRRTVAARPLRGG